MFGNNPQGTNRREMIASVVHMLQQGIRPALLETERRRNYFKDERFVVFPKLLETRSTRFLCRYALTKARQQHGGADSSTDLKTVISLYADPIMEELLCRLVPVAEGICGAPVYPTYSYLRVYRFSETLPSHTDRGACEITLSLNLGCMGMSMWPLWIETKEGVRRVDLEPGDGVLFRGIDQRHWREPFRGTASVQLLLHMWRKKDHIHSGFMTVDRVFRCCQTVCPLADLTLAIRRHRKASRAGNFIRPGSGEEGCDWIASRGYFGLVRDD